MRAQLASEAKYGRTRLTLLMTGLGQTAYLREEVLTCIAKGTKSLKERLCRASSPLSSKFKFNILIIYILYSLIDN
nr:MAG TPA: hypothetical protein [Caudoviricetes sp.]